jgi:hypothetical protein
MVCSLLLLPFGIVTLSLACPEEFEGSKRALIELLNLILRCFNKLSMTNSLWLRDKIKEFELLALHPKPANTLSP